MARWVGGGILACNLVTMARLLSGLNKISTNDAVKYLSENSNQFEFSNKCFYTVTNYRQLPARPKKLNADKCNRHG